MKSKGKDKPRLMRQLVDFVDGIAMHGEDPQLWPLSTQEQILFIRKAIYQARKIRHTEAYKAENLKLAAEDLAMAS